MSGPPGLVTAVVAPASPTTARRPLRLSRLYAALVRTEVQAASAYRAELILSGFAWVVPLAFLALWHGASARGPVDGVTSTQFATYFCLLLATTGLQVTLMVIFDFGDLVYSGQLSAQLLKPVHPLHACVGRAMAHKVFSVPPLAILVPVALALTGGRVVAGAGGWLVAVLVALIGFACFVHLAAISAALAFWMTKAQGIQGLLLGAEWILGGIVAPVALLPGPLPQILRHQPLWYADAAAPEILSGISSPSPWVIVEALAWLVGLHLAYRAIWRRGIRRYEAVGT